MKETLSATILNVITLVNVLLLAWLFRKTKNGVLKKSFIMFFVSLAWGLLAVISMGFGIFTATWLGYVVSALPLTVTSVFLARYIYYSYR